MDDYLISWPQRRATMASLSLYNCVQKQSSECCLFEIHFAAIAFHGGLVATTLKNVAMIIMTVVIGCFVAVKLSSLYII